MSAAGPSQGANYSSSGGSAAAPAASVGVQHPNARLIESFYNAFARRDGRAMATCYGANATFADPVFDLRGAEIGAMWTMLCERGADLRIEARDIAADDHAGRAHWEAWYTFSASGRPVHNEIDAAFAFSEGMIASHRDVFDLWRWSRMALGKKGVLLGWTPLVRKAIRKQARKSLDAWIARAPERA
jgi:ketosteroid isomerase-like protein